MTPLRKRVLWALGIVIVTALVVLGAAAKRLNDFGRGPGPLLSTVEIEISPGTSARQIGRILEERGIISSELKFFLYLRFIAQKTLRLQAGDYEFTPGQSPDQIITMMQKGRHKEIRFTVPEGASKNDIAQIIASAGFGQKGEILAAMNDPNLAKSYGIDATVSGGIEGYLFPDTYQFPKKTKIDAILMKMHARLEQVLTPDLRARMQGEQLDLHTLLTMASLVEKETADKSERPIIARVFLNRLQRKMKLQTDPTVIYTIPNYSGNITKADLSRNDPYNTYVHAGLPPGPIASPGLEAIKAVLWPADGPYLYFVSRNDKTHVFCPDYRCHTQAVKKWQVDFFKKKQPAS